MIAASAGARGAAMYPADRDNPWIAAALGAARPARAWIIAISLLLGTAAVLLPRWTAAPLVALAGSGPSPWRIDLRTALIAGSVFVPLLAIAFAGGALEGRRIWRLGARPLVAGLGGLALGAAGLALSLAVASLAGAVTPGAGPAPTLALAGAMALDALMILLAAVAEETYFRGWLQPLLGARWGVWVGLFATAALFAALHLVGGARSVTAAVNIFLAGVLFGLLALRSGGLLAPCAAHFGWNWMEAQGFGSDPNPGTGPFGALFDLDLKGPALWSGGADTLNGSLATTLVLSALIAGLMLATRLKAVSR